MEIQINKSKEVLRVGKVISVKGRTIEVLVDKTKNNSHLLFEGQLVRNVSVGSYVKITKGFEQLIGKIESEFVVEDKAFSQSLYKKESYKIKRTLSISLVGYFETNSFEQGVKELPLIDNECFILTKVEYDRVHSFVKDGEDKINIGVLSSETSKEIELSVNSLFASHIGIFGNTGSGKSYSLASLYHSLFKKYEKHAGFKKNAKFLLIDFNGEYIKNKKGNDAIHFESSKEIIDYPNKKIPILRKSLENIEILSIILDATEKTQKPFLKSCLDYSKFNNENFCYKEFIKDIVDALISKKDKEYGTKAFLNLFNDLYECVENKDILLSIKELITDELGHYTTGSYYSISVEKDVTSCDITNTGNGNAKFDIRNLTKYFIVPLKEKIDILRINSEHLLINFLLKIILKYHLDITNGHSNIEHISPLIRRAKSILLKLDEIIEVVLELKFEKNLKIISLKDVNDNSIKKILALIVCKEVYDEQKSSTENQFLNIIIDEAHNILSPSSLRESESWKDYRLETFEEIIKEGRKFGTFLTLASQRPSDISSTIISQLHNYFLHRLINNKDIEAIEKTVSYLDKVSFESLPILPTGTCIIAGLSAKLPVVVKMHKLDEEFQPNSQTIKLTDFWKDDVSNAEETESEVDTNDDDLPF